MKRYFLVFLLSLVVIALTAASLAFAEPQIESSPYITHFTYSATGCLDLDTDYQFLYPELLNRELQRDAYGEDCEDVEFIVEGHDLTYYHYSVIYNCCATMVVQLNLEEALVQFIEVETFLEGPCYCICPFDLTATIFNLPTGEYTVEVWNEDFTILYCRAEIEIEL